MNQPVDNPADSQGAANDDATQQLSPPPAGDAPIAPGDKTPPPVVEFRGVTKVFNPGTHHEFMAIKDISFAIDDLPGKGELIAIIGPSGCGKSTVLNLISGFPDVYPPTTGEVLVRGQRVTGPGRDRGMIFQKYSSFPNRTVLSNVMFGLEINQESLRISRQQMIEMAMAFIGKVGLRGHEHKYPYQLSGGQQQRVAIARSLVLKPRIILMDEPFSALDEPTRLDMQRLIIELWQEVEATVFIVTHSITEAIYLADRLWVFSKAPGRIIKEIRDLFPPVAGEDPRLVQESPEFQGQVAEIAEFFRRVQAGEFEEAKHGQ